MVSRSRQKRMKEYPRPHNFYYGWGIALDTNNTNITNFQITHQDEAIVASAVKTNPENSAFAEYASSNCSTDSEVTNVFTELRFTLAPLGLTDSLGGVRIFFLPISSAFEDLDAVDEKTSVTVGAVLELTKETDERQVLPIWTGNDLNVKYTGSTTLHTDIEGLTTNQLMESVNFDIDLWYDVLNYYTIAGKLRSVTKGLRWITLNANHPTRRILIRQTSKTKRQVPYSNHSVIIGAPVAGSKYQIPMLADVTTGVTVLVDMQTRYFEWNEEYDSTRI